MKNLFKFLFNRQGRLPTDSGGNHPRLNRQVPTLECLAEQANIVLESEYDYGPEAFERSDKYSPLDLIRLQFAHCWCHHFACSLRELVKWPIVKVSDCNRLTIHRLNRDFEGRLVDVTGFVTEGSLRRRYKDPKLKICDDWALERDSLLDDDSMAEIMAVMLYLPYEPFIEMRERVKHWVMYGQTGVDSPQLLSQVNE